MEGQYIGPPPTEQSMEAAGNLTDLMAEGVPGLDLDGNTPIEVPNTPPPIPAPLEPPQMPPVLPPQEKPPPLDLVTPAPVAFGLDVARTLPQRQSSPEMTMPSLPDFSAMKQNPKGTLLVSIALVNSSREKIKGSAVHAASSTLK
jgi:hypothetical protein